MVVVVGGGGGVGGCGHIVLAADSIQSFSEK